MTSRHNAAAEARRRRTFAISDPFEDPYWLQRVENDHPDLTLDPILTH